MEKAKIESISVLLDTYKIINEICLALGYTLHIEPFENSIADLGDKPLEMIVDILQRDDDQLIDLITSYGDGLISKDEFFAGVDN
jgi:hypothetical protein